MRNKAMKLAKLTIFSMLLLSIGGCSGRVVLLKNEQGELAKCEVKQGEAMIAGVINRDLSIEDGVKQYEAAGYKKISE
jgi:hypothetical protein